MTPNREKAARELLAFYQEAGVDALLGETPADRFADEPAISAPAASAPAASSAPAWTQALPDRRSAGAAPAERTIVYARDLDARTKASAAPPPPDTAVMAAREAARGAASLDEL